MKCLMCGTNMIETKEENITKTECENKCMRDTLVDNGTNCVSSYSLQVKGRNWLIQDIIDSEQWNASKKSIISQAIKYISKRNNNIMSNEME